TSARRPDVRGARRPRRAGKNRTEPDKIQYRIIFYYDKILNTYNILHKQYSNREACITHSTQIRNLDHDPQRQFGFVRFSYAKERLTLSRWLKPNGLHPISQRGSHHGYPTAPAGARRVLEP